MATLTPGPLASSISGSIGGMTVADRHEGLIARARTTNTSRATNRKTTQQTLLAAAAAAWSTLTPAAKDTWRTNRPGDPPPRSAFIAACFNHPGFPQTIPEMTAAAFTTAPAMPTLVRVGNRPTLAGFTGALALDESVRFKTYSGLTPHAATGFDYLRGDRRVTGAQGLDFPTTQALAFLVDAANLAATYTFTPDGNWTVEAYAAPTIANEYHTLFRFTTPAIRLDLWRTSLSKLQITYGAASQTIVTAPPDGTAHHYALTSIAATSLAQVYYDGAPIGAPLAITPAALTGLLLWGNQGIPSNRYIAGALNWATIWNTPLSAATLATRRIDDAFYPGQPGPGCQLLLKCQSAAAGAVLDYSGNGRNFTASATTPADSVFWQTLDNISSPPWTLWSARIRATNFTPPYPLPSPLVLHL